MRWPNWVLAICLTGWASLAAAEFKPLKLDTTHSRMGFEASTLLFDVDGEFNEYRVEVEGDPADPSHAKLRVVIDAASLDTGNATRDKHLRSADFFDVKKHPKITFVSDRISQSGDQLTVRGTLEMHGKKQTLTIPFRVTKGKNGAGIPSTAYKGEVTIDRTKFGIGTDSVAAKISLHDEVTLDLLIVMLQA